MPEVRGFRGWRYDRAKVGHLSAVVAPPYDVISKKEQETLYRKSPYNVVRLILGREEPQDSPASNRYTRARAFLNEWKRTGVLTRDSLESIYVYAQDYREEGRTRRRIGLIAAMKLDEGPVLRHENTLTAPKKDRMALLKEVRTNLSPIFGLVEDKKGGLQRLLKGMMESAPCVNVTLHAVRHRLFLESRPAVVEMIRQELRSKPMFIADGHHRFEVACQFRRWMNQQVPGQPEAEWNYVMTYFSDCRHNPFKIFPTHRLIAVSKKFKEPLKRLGQRGQLKKMKNLAATLSVLAKSRNLGGQRGLTPEVKGSDPFDPRRTYAFGVFTRKDGYFIFKLRRKFSSKIGKSPAVKLDVAVLHHEVIEPCFGLRAIEKSKAIDFTRDAAEACKEVKKGRFDMAIFVRPTSLEEMIEVSKKGLRMPQKSTYFYPKLLSGLVFHDLRAS